MEIIFFSFFKITCEPYYQMSHIRLYLIYFHYCIVCCGVYSALEDNIA